jgi:hypothetical protein
MSLFSRTGEKKSPSGTGFISIMIAPPPEALLTAGIFFITL